MTDTIRRVLDAFELVEVHLAHDSALPYGRQIPAGLFRALQDFQLELAVIERGVANMGTSIADATQETPSRSRAEEP